MVNRPVLFAERALREGSARIEVRSKKTTFDTAVSLIAWAGEARSAASPPPCTMQEEGAARQDFPAYAPHGVRNWRRRLGWLLLLLRLLLRQRRDRPFVPMTAGIAGVARSPRAAAACTAKD